MLQIAKILQLLAFQSLPGHDGDNFMRPHLPEDFQQEGRLPRPAFRVDDERVDVPEIDVQGKKLDVNDLQIFIENRVQLQGAEGLRPLLVLLAVQVKDLAEHQQPTLHGRGLELKLIGIEMLRHELVWKPPEPAILVSCTASFMVGPDSGKPF